MVKMEYKSTKHLGEHQGACIIYKRKKWTTNQSVNARGKLLFFIDVKIGVWEQSCSL